MRSEPFKGFFNDNWASPHGYYEERKVKGRDKEAVNVQFKLVWESSELTLTDPMQIVPRVSLRDLKKINLDFHSTDKSIIIRINFENTKLSWFFLSSTDSRWLSETEEDLSKIFYAYRTENELLHTWIKGSSIYISLSLLSAFLISIPLDLISWGEFSFAKYICALVVSVPCLYGWGKFLRWLYPWFETPIMWRTKYRSRILLIILYPLIMIAVLYGTAIKTTDVLFNIILKVLAICSVVALYLWFRKAGKRKFMRPTVINTSPVDGASNVPPDSPVQATFSEPMSGSTFNIKTFVIKRDNDESTVTGRLTLSPDARTVSFDPEPDFSYNTRYSVTIYRDVKGKGGNELTSKVRWTFTTREKDFPSGIVTYDRIGMRAEKSVGTFNIGSKIILSIWVF